MMRFMGVLLGLVIVSAVALVLFAKWRNADMPIQDAVYTLIFGAPNVAPIDFATLERRTSPNDALACPERLCRRAEPDFVTRPILLSKADILASVQTMISINGEHITDLGETTEADGFTKRMRGVRTI